MIAIYTQNRQAVWNFSDISRLHVTGNGHSKYGIYNRQKKEFQFGICEDTPMLAIGYNGREVTT